MGYKLIDGEVSRLSRRYNIKLEDDFHPEAIRLVKRKFDKKRKECKRKK